MEKFYEAMEQVEAFIAGRYYENEKIRIVEFIAKINNLSEDETAELKALCLNDGINKLNSVQAVSNALVMLHGKKNAEKVRELLLARKKQLLKLEADQKWRNREEWLRYLNSKVARIDRCMEKAIFLYAREEAEKAFAVFKDFADMCHIFSLKACLVLSRESGNEQSELRYLTIIQRVYDELLAMPLPKEMKDRMCELKAHGYESIKEDMDVAIDYFDESNTFKMAFKA